MTEQATTRKVNTVRFQRAVNPQIAEMIHWLDTACAPFNNISANRILENDTQYDIDLLKVEFNVTYTRIFGKPPIIGQFEHEVRKRCKQPSRQSEYRYDDSDVDSD